MAEATFAPTDEQLLLSSTISEMLDARSSADRTKDLSLTQDAFDREVWEGLAQIGVIGLTMPAAFGGGEASLDDLGVVFEELGRRIVAIPLLSTTMAMTAIVASGSSDAIERHLPVLCSGDAVGTLAVYEDAHGDALDLPGASAVRDGEDAFLVTGRKAFVTDGPGADLFVVSASLDGVFALFLVEATGQGVTVAAVPALDATRPLATVSLDNAVATLLAEGDAAVATLSTAIDVGVVAMAREQVGGASACLDMSVEYAKSRFQFGRAIGSFQAVKHMCADVLVALEHARSVAVHACRAGDPDEQAIAVPMAKSVCSDAYIKAAGDMIQIHGGIGFTWEHDAHLYFKRAKSTSLLLGSVDAYRDRLADALDL